MRIRSYAIEFIKYKILKMQNSYELNNQKCLANQNKKYFLKKEIKIYKKHLMNRYSILTFT